MMVSRQPSTVASDVIDLSSDTEGQPLFSSQAYSVTIDLVDTDDEDEPCIDVQWQTKSYDRLGTARKDSEFGFRDPLKRDSSSLLTKLDSFSQSLASGGGGGGGSDESATQASNKRKSPSPEEGKGSPSKKAKTVRKPRMSQV